MGSIKVNDIIFEASDFWDYYNENYRNHRIIRVIGDEGKEEAEKFKSSFKPRDVAVIYCAEDYFLHEKKLLYCGTRIEYYNSVNRFIEKEITKELIDTLNELKEHSSLTTNRYRSLRGTIRSGNFENYKNFLVNYHTRIVSCEFSELSIDLCVLNGRINQLIHRVEKSLSDENRNVLEDMFRKQCEISVSTRDVEIWHDHTIPLIRTRDGEYPVEFILDDLGRLKMKTSTGGNGLEFIDFYGAKPIQYRILQIKRPYSEFSKDMNIAAALFEMWNKFVLRKECKAMKIL